eukprot:6193786-Pleurochrysis_carterae.AAC.3
MGIQSGHRRAYRLIVPGSSWEAVRLTDTRLELLRRHFVTEVVGRFSISGRPRRLLSFCVQGPIMSYIRPTLATTVTSSFLAGLVVLHYKKALMNPYRPS